MRTLLILLSSVGLVVWSVSPQPMSKLKKEEITIVVSPEHPEIVEVRTAADEISSNKKIVKPDLPEVLKPVLQGHEPLPTNPKLITPVAEGRVPSDLSKKIFYASHDDHQFGRKTLDLSGLDLDGEDVMQALHSLDAETLRGVARLDLSRNRVWSLPARVWPLQLEYSLLELRLDHNRLNLADPINTQTTRFELTRLLSLEKLSLSHCDLGITLESMEWPPVQFLNLSYNRFVELPDSLPTLTKLENLDVSGNRIRYLCGSPLSQLTSLRFLNLSNNGLETIWDDPIAELYRLETLHLDHNALSEPPKFYEFTGSYQPPMEVLLSGNPFACGCAFKKSLDNSRLEVLDKLNVTCVDSGGVEWSVDAAVATRCSHVTEAVSRTWASTRDWLRYNRPDWSTLIQLLGWVLFGITLGLYRAKKTRTTTAAEVPYNTLDDQANWH